MRICLPVLALALSLVSHIEAYTNYVPPAPAATPVRPYHEPIPYCRPGVIHLADNVWVGSDNLSEVPNYVRAFVEIVSDPFARIWLPAEQIWEDLEREFTQVGSTLQRPEKNQEGFRPFLHLLVNVMPVQEGYAVSVALRYLDVDEGLQRGHLTQGRDAWQVITWERQALFFAFIGDLIGSVKRQVACFAEQFAQRYAHERHNYEAQQRKMQNHKNAAPPPSQPPPPQKQQMHPPKGSTPPCRGPGCLSNYSHTTGSS